MSEGELKVDGLVVYDHDGQTQLAVITQIPGKKVKLLTMRERETDLSPARLDSIPGKIPSDFTSPSEKAKFLLDLRDQALAFSEEVPLEEIWGFVQEDAKEFTCSELTSLYYGEDKTIEHLTLRIALNADKIFFKRKKNSYIPRPEGTILELKKGEELKLEREKQKEIALDECIRAAKGEGVEFSNDTLNFIKILEQAAANTSSTENAQIKEAKHFLEAFQEKSSMSLPAGREESAFRFLTLIKRFHQNTNLSFIRHGLRENWGEASLHELKKLSGGSLETEERIDCSHLELFTIDDSETEDMDDALSLERIEGGYRVGIHITDVSSYIEKDSELDCDARSRATSHYFPEKTVHMFPKEFAENIGSLRAKEPRNALSCFVTFSPAQEIIKHELQLTKVVVNEKLSYDSVDQILDPPSGEIGELYHLAMAYASLRHARGGMKIPKRQVKVTLSDRSDLANSDFTLEEYSESTPARDLVGEMMILANETMAKFASENKIPFIYRSQEPQDPGSLKNLDDVPPGPAYDAALRGTLKRSNTGTVPGTHATLGVDFYGQVTSPIRRYLDLVNQRQLVAYLKNQQLPYSEQDLDLVIAETSESLQSGRLMSRETHRFWILKYLKRKSKKKELITATIVRDDGRHYQVELDEVFIPSLLKTQEKLKKGDRLELDIQSVTPTYDYLKLGLKRKL